MSAPLPEQMGVPVFAGEGRIDWTEKPVPVPGPGEVLLRVGANAMCGTDRLQHRFGSPVVPGHEVAGTVVARGENVDIDLGSVGVAYLMGYCASCRSCLLGHTNQCLDKSPDLGFERDGGYAPFAVVPARQLWTVDGIDAADATLLLDVMGTSGHAIERARRMRPDIESVAIAGAGPIGLGLVVMLRVMLGDELPVYVSDLSPYRLALAERLGAMPVEHLRDAREVDAAFDATGHEEPRRQLLDSLAKRGVLVCIGHGRGLALRVSPDLIATERCVMGSEYFRFEELQANTERLHANRELVRAIVTHRLPASSLVEAFDLFLAGETGKVVIVHEQQ